MPFPKRSGFPLSLSALSFPSRPSHGQWLPWLGLVSGGASHDEFEKFGGQTAFGRPDSLRSLRPFTCSLLLPMQVFPQDKFLRFGRWNGAALW